MKKRSEVAANNALYKALSELEFAAERSHDIEGAHVAADRVLCEVVRILAELHYGSMPPVVDEILECYREVPKWYA